MGQSRQARDGTGRGGRAGQRQVERRTSWIIIWQGRCSAISSSLQYPEQSPSDASRLCFGCCCALAKPIAVTRHTISCVTTTQSQRRHMQKARGRVYLDDGDHPIADQELRTEVLFDTTHLADG